ncbi:MAG: FtsW/RodA/SpoVE family cell cycle protein [Firmicutes bacterium]|nr:FtsW/RodA/SpoVE family cell cycle protein [Bacillota bacterium]
MEGITFTIVFTMIVRWIFVVLAGYILASCIISLVRAKNPAEVWAYVTATTYEETGDGVFNPASSISVPVTHWENVIGRAGNCDIRVNDKTLSRNHGILMRNTSGRWIYRDLGSKNGTYLDDLKISKEGEMGPPIKLEYGDVLRTGLTEFMLLPISLEEKNNNQAMRKSDTKVMSAGPTLAAITLFQILTIFQLWISMGAEYLDQIVFAIGGFCVLMWLYTGVLKTVGRTGFEIECIAFFLSTLSMAVVASSAPTALFKQFVAVCLGVVIMFVMCVILRNLEISKTLRWLLMAVSVVLLLANLAFGTIGFGAKNWIEIGSFSFQPSELVKVAFIWIGAASLDELFQKKNLWVFMGFSAFCLGCLGIMGDFGTAIIFFVTFLIISFLRSGDFSKLFLMGGAAAAAGFMVIRFKPYVAQRFATWGKAWSPELINGAGYQQTRTMSAAAGGGFAGVGAGNGWLQQVAAADTDMVFGMLVEEWGLIIALLAVLSIVTLALFAVRSIMAGRSAYYTIAACGAMSMFVFQTMLNVFGSLDMMPFTGVTFPFISNGGNKYAGVLGLAGFSEIS